MNAGEISFEQWVNYLFNRVVTNEHWHWTEEDPLELPNQKFIEFGTKLFEHSGELLASYSDAQVDQGLTKIISNIFSNEIYALSDSSVPFRLREQFLKAIYTLNRDCFNKRCTPHLSHLDKTATPEFVSRLNHICFMWWDIFPAYRDDQVETMELNRVCLRVLKQSLELSNIATIEGALHGFGEFHSLFPECGSIVSDFLGRKPDLPLPLLQYAQNARVGNVL